MPIFPTESNDRPILMSSAKFWRRTGAAIQGTNSREAIESALHTYVSSWETGAVDERLDLFADDIVMEDPATVVRASNKAELEVFLRAGIPPDWRLSFAFIRSVVVGDEAILTYQSTLTTGTNPPAQLLINSHVCFNHEGKIDHMRVFWDTDSITETATPA
jgi:ketosteroid isomerase-like protein